MKLNSSKVFSEKYYYPFGLTMAGISSRASGALENKKKFTSQTFDDDLGWNTYQMKWRTMDPQIGRFLQIDHLSTEYVYNSTYAYAENDVIRAIDIEGLEKYIKIISEVEGTEVVKKTIFTKVDEKGQLVDQNLRSNSNNQILTEEEAYTFDDKAGTDAPSNATPADKFIVKNGIKDVDNGPSQPNDFKTNNVKVAYTDPVAKGEKVITSEGYVASTTGALIDKNHTNSQKVAASPGSLISMTKDNLVAATGGKKMNTAVIFTVSPENKAFYKQVQAASQKQQNMQVIRDPNQKVNTFNITVVGVQK